MAKDFLKFDRMPGGVAVLTLNRPEVMNAINMSMSDELKGALGDIEDDADIRVVVITGAGDRAFSAGYDIHEMASFGREEMEGSFVSRDPVLWLIANNSKPIIAALNGLAYGGGALIATAADIRIGCEKTEFRVTSTSYGSANATWTLPHIVGLGRAKELLMTGRSVDSTEAERIGLLNHVVREDELMDKALAVAREIAGHPAEGARAIKVLLNEGIGRTYADQYHAERDAVTARGWSDGEAVFARFLNSRNS
jgi:enoyl-CoA hydratase/carnithine racemase